MSASEQFYKQINENPYLSEWKNKIDQQLKTNQHKHGETSEETIVKYALDYIYDYHNTVNAGRLWKDNRQPNEDDINAFSKIVTAILYEWQTIGQFDNIVTVQERIRKKLSDALKEEITD